MDIDKARTFARGSTTARHAGDRARTSGPGSTTGSLPTQATEDTAPATAHPGGATDTDNPRTSGPEYTTASRPAAAAATAPPTTPAAGTKAAG